MKLAIVLEAAGNSTRFGSNKLLHVMDDGRPMVSAILDTVRSVCAACSKPGLLSIIPVIVTQYNEVADLAPDFDVIINDRPDLGISYSMQLGIEADGDADAYMFCVCDQPGLTAATLIRMIDTFCVQYEEGSARIVSLAWQGTMYSPKIFSCEYRAELMKLSGDTGGRQIIRSHSDDLILVEASCISEVLDIDRPGNAEL